MTPEQVLALLRLISDLYAQVAGLQARINELEQVISDQNGDGV